MKSFEDLNPEDQFSYASWVMCIGGDLLEAISNVIKAPVPEAAVFYQTQANECFSRYKAATIEAWETYRQEQLPK